MLYFPIDNKRQKADRIGILKMLRNTRKLIKKDRKCIKTEKVSIK